MKCCLLVSGMMFGGGQRVVADLMETVNRARDIHASITLIGQRTVYFDRFEPIVIRYDGRYNRPYTLVATAWRLRRSVQQRNVNLIHTHGWDADVIAWLARRRMGISQIVHFHVMPAWLKSNRLKHRIRRGITRRVLKDPATVSVAVSDAVRQHWAKYLEINSDAIRVIHNGVNTNEYRSRGSTVDSESKSINVGLAARLVRWKGLNVALDAVCGLVEEGCRFKVVVAGDGPDRDALERRVSDLCLADYVHFLGQVADMPAFFRSLDVFVCPSLDEGMPLCVLEAMASGVPVVSTCVGGIPEAIRDGVDGVLVQPGDAEALANALREMLAAPKTRYQMGQSAMQRARGEFSIDETGNNIVALYRQLLEPIPRTAT